MPDDLSSLRDDLSSLKDDMTAFIEGHGMRRFPGLVSYEEVQAVMWKGDHPDGWKDFVELAKAAGTIFLTMEAWVLDREALDELVERLRSAPYAGDEDLEDARWLRAYISKTGFVQLGWAYQGSLFLYEASTEWYDRYQHLMQLVEDYGGIAIDESDEDDEH
jgi:hypothetical protein